VFGILLLPLMFVAGRSLGGRDVGWAAFLVTAVAHLPIALARQARYYSPAITLSAACCLIAWRVRRRGGWFDYLAAALVFALLFHTHIVSFLVACAAGTIAIAGPIWRRIRHHEHGAWIRPITAAAILLAATVPWVVATGFLSEASGIPPARNFLKFGDYFVFMTDSIAKIAMLGLLGTGLVALIASHAFHDQMPERLRALFGGKRRGAAYFLVAWCVIGYFGFALLMPAVSYAEDRVMVPILAPALLLAALTCSAIGHAIAGRITHFGAAGIFLIFMAACRTLAPWPTSGAGDPARDASGAIAWLRQHEFRPGTRIYATPGNQLTLTVYTGIPVQSVAPIRKSFLDSYPHDIVVIDAAIPFAVADRKDIRALATASGQKRLSDAEALKLASDVAFNAVVRRIADDGAEATPWPREINVPHYLNDFASSQSEYTRHHLSGRFSPAVYNPAVFRDTPLTDLTQWWPIYFYRFVNPQERMGEKLNYADRVRTARAWILPPVGWRVYVSPGRVASPQLVAQKGDH
jgi:hypothetical protein